MLKAVLSPFADRAYALLRIIAGLMFSFHGMQKIFGLLSDHPKPGFGTQTWFGGMIELAAGLAIAIGLFTRCAAFLASGTMAVAFWQFHVIGSKLEGISRLLPGTNMGELAALYCWLFLFIACKGGGPWSVDARRAKKRSESS